MNINKDHNVPKIRFFLFTLSNLVCCKMQDDLTQKNIKKKVNGGQIYKVLPKLRASSKVKLVETFMLQRYTRKLLDIPISVARCGSNYDFSHHITGDLKKRLFY